MSQPEDVDTRLLEPTVVDLENAPVPAWMQDELVQTMSLDTLLALPKSTRCALGVSLSERLWLRRLDTLRPTTADLVYAVYVQDEATVYQMIRAWIYGRPSASEIQLVVRTCIEKNTFEIEYTHIAGSEERACVVKKLQDRTVFHVNVSATALNHDTLHLRSLLLLTSRVTGSYPDIVFALSELVDCSERHQHQLAIELRGFIALKVGFEFFNDFETRYNIYHQHRTT